ncbi:MAG TPA: hypothetical protein VKV24_15320 [Casimicrobiaceae bacterium]|nr:hypothetical protein [Casimicrobiaceae bacterium]
MRNRQRGWLGLIIILLALVIVGIAARSALKSYGLFDDSGKAGHAAAPGANEAEQAATITPRDALERAKSVQDMVKQGAIEQEKRIDDAIPK